MKVSTALRAQWARTAEHAKDVRDEDIHPATVSIGDTEVINAEGQWVGDPTGLIGPQGPAGADGPLVVMEPMEFRVSKDRLVSPAFRASRVSVARQGQEGNRGFKGHQACPDLRVIPPQRAPNKSHLCGFYR